MGQFFEYEMTVDSRDVDGWGRCRPSAVLGYLQEAATLAAEDGGFGREKTLEYHAFWMLARIWFRLDRPLRWEEKVTVRTWHRGSKTALMYRDFDLLAGGVPVGEAVSAWVLAGVEDRKLLRLSQMRELEGTEGGGLCKQLTLSKLRMPGEMEERDRRRMGVQRYRHQRPCEQHPLRRLRMRCPAAGGPAPQPLSERAPDRIHRREPGR